MPSPLQEISNLFWNWTGIMNSAYWDTVEFIEKNAWVILCNKVIR